MHLTAAATKALLILPPTQPCAPKLVCEATVQLASLHGMLASLEHLASLIVSRTALTACATQVLRNRRHLILLAPFLLLVVGWRGDSCSLPRCRDTCDPVGGTCSVPGGCECNLGYSGPNCDIGECISQISLCSPPLMNDLTQRASHYSTHPRHRLPELLITKMRPFILISLITLRLQVIRSEVVMLGLINEP
jgi:hypothetical protein